MTNRFRIRFLCSLLFLFSATAFGQWNYVVNGKVTANNEALNLEGAVVTLYKDGSQSGQVVTKKNGKYTFVLDPDHEYILSFTKAGFITKKIFISTKNVPPDRAKYGFSNQPIDVDLFEMPPDPNVVAKINDLLSEPMGKFVYVPSAQDFDFDAKYAAEVKKKLKELLKIQEDLEKKKSDKAYQDAQFQNYVNAGNTLYSQGKFNDALGQYQNALNINPGDAGLIAKVEDTKKKIQEENNRKALFEKYLAIIKVADGLFKASDWIGAKSKYEEALGLVSTEKYPKDQIELCNKEIEKNKLNAEAKQKYDAAVKEGDEFFKAGKYQDAMSSYTKALGFIPTEKYPKDQIVLCQTKIKEQTELENKYLAALKKGDDGFKARDWNSAKAGYNDALGLKPNEKYPKDQLDLIAKEEVKDGVEKQYTGFILKADGFFKSKDWANAKSNYEEALKLKAGEKYPKDQILLCQKELDKEKAGKDLQAKYDAAIKEGDDAFKASMWDNAITAYGKALGLKPGEKYPTDQIGLCKAELEKLKSQKDLELKYNAAVKEGDDAFKLKKWDAAMVGYKKALALKAGEPYPTGQIDLCKTELDKLKGEKELLEKYNAAIKEGDDAFKLKKWEVAITGYTKALNLKPGESYPAGQISLCNAELDKIKDSQERYAAAIKEGDAAFSGSQWENAITSYQKALGIKPGEKYPTDQITKAKLELDKIHSLKNLQEKYDAAVKEGDNAFKASLWDNAVTAYSKALGIKPGEKYPADQIGLCKAELEKIKAQKDILAKYNAAIKEGDDAFKLKKYELAVSAYTRALGIKPGETYPQTQIDLCNTELNKLKDAKELQAKYDAAVLKGDNAFKGKSWDDAIAAYTDALSYKPGAPYPTSQIALCNQELDKIRSQNELNEKYNAAVKEGDNLFKAGNFGDAITAYTKASGIKPLEKYPPVQISLCKVELDKMKNQKDMEAKYELALKEGDGHFQNKKWQEAMDAYNKALGFKPGQKYPSDQIIVCKSELDKIRNANDLKTKYDNAIKKADVLFGTNKYADAITVYKEAQGYMPAEKYPADQIALCNVRIGEWNKNNKLEQDYLAAIKEGDGFFKGAKFEDAITAYTRANGLKPAEKYPPAQIELCRKELEKKKGAEDLQAKYDLAVKNGNSNFDAKEYGTARKFYEEALGYKPQEKYPKDRLAEIEKLIGMNRKKYEQLIKDADLLYKKQDWTNALNKYTEASGLQPEEKYPKDKITEINAILDKLKSEQDKLKAEKELNDKYKAAVDAGDIFFAKKDYVNARMKYEEAKNIFPTQTYPPLMIGKCDQMLANADPKFKEYNGYIIQGDKAFKEGRYTDARSYYQAALDVKPEEKYPAGKIKEIDALLKDKQINMEKDMAIKEYLRLIKEADKLFGERNWNKAKILYGQALSLQPVEQYPKERIAQCDAFLKGGNDPVKPKDNTYQTDAEYEKARKKRFTDMTAKYGGPGRYEVPPQSDGYKTISEVVIITDSDATVYRKVEFKFGQIIYYKNDVAINPADYEAAVNR
ncbi:MAG: hypothetical protein IT233_11895 [Bacteroidia bacterium]|nr:hypothetical protein [Bacteroidia bacterium]